MRSGLCVGARNSKGRWNDWVSWGYGGPFANEPIPGGQARETSYCTIQTVQEKSSNIN